MDGSGSAPSHTKPSEDFVQEVYNSLRFHDYVTLLIKRTTRGFIDNNYISSSELYLQTISVLRLAKYAILYLVSARTMAESQKPIKTSEPIKYNIAAGNSLVDLRKKIIY